MATFHQTSYFRVFTCISWILLGFGGQKTDGDTVHIMSVTPTPYGAALVGTTYSCLLSNPDTDQLNSITSYRHVWRGMYVPYNVLTLPHLTGTAFDGNLNKRTTTLPGTLDAYGVYFCEASSRGLTTRVPITILYSYRYLHPSNGHFTVTADAGSSVQLSVDVRVPIPGLSEDTDITWEKQTDGTTDFEIFENFGKSFNINPVLKESAGVYAAYWRGHQLNFVGSLIRLIVRECVHGRWGPPSCTSICDNCYNGGICDDKTGECVCRPGFTGHNCLTVCGENKFGWDCEHECGAGLAVSSCVGSVFCMPDPVGCSCMTGYMGTECNQECLPGKFGTGCTEGCHCATESCNRFTGECDNNGACSAGWSGLNCQVPDTCPPGYYGAMCTDKCNCYNCDKTTGSCLNSLWCFTGFCGQTCDTECHCLNGAACDRITAKCYSEGNTGLALCAPGYVSDTGNNLDNCQHYAGCFADCTKTCRCSHGSTYCDTVSGQCTDLNAQCTAGWTGMSCQTGVVELTYVKTNPNQPVSVTCVVTGDPDIPGEDDVKLNHYIEDTKSAVYANQVGSQLRDRFLFAFFQANPPPGNWLLCTLAEGSQATYASITPEYFVLPVLSEAPSVVDTQPTRVTLQWDAWASSTDVGNGSVVAYKVYNTDTSEEVKEVTAPSSTVIQTIVQPLTPSTNYSFYVTAVREGEGGEGPPSPFVNVSTLPMTTEAPTPTMSTTRKKTPSGSKPPSSTQPVPTSVTMDISSQGLPASSTGEEVYIIIGVIVALAFILIFIIVLIWFLRRRRNQPKHYPPSVVNSEIDRSKTVFPDDVDAASMHETHSMSTLDGIDNISHELEENREVAVRPKSQPPPIDTEKPMQRDRSKSSDLTSSSVKIKLRIPPVNIKEYATYVKNKRQGSDLSVEWESLPNDVSKPATIAKKSENKGKNRYRNVVAYDHSRVVLEPFEDDPDSDYINACYMKGISNPRTYIASQGPNDVTIHDYWKMVWQENISVMVMACNVFEEGRCKCAKYWPEENVPLASNDITIILESEEQKEEYYIVRKFHVSVMGQASRGVLQFHYTMWPDKDVPKHCTPVLKFIKDVNENHDRKAPLLIHCSAGAGRTGAIIAIHGMMELAEEKGQVDIYNFVCSMRNNRPNMVQTSAQYTFIHDAMLEYLFCKDTFIQANMLASKLKSLKEQNPETNRTYLEDEYEILNLVSPNFSSSRTRGTLRQESLAKLRSGDSIPVDSSRPYLMTERGDGDMSPYINAAYMDGYKKKDLFISTQMPLTNTVVDLWRMMYDYNCTSIVMLNAMDPEYEDCPQFWPDAGTGDFGPFTVTLLEQESTQDFVMRTLQLVYTKRDVKSPIPVRHFQYMTWPKDDERPATSHGILQLISAVEKWQKTLPEPGPIVVLCMNAAGRSGAFCTIQTALDQVREEQGVDVLQSVKNLRIHRTNMVDTPAKYLFCYETILEYLQAFDDYSRKKPYQNVPDLNKQKEEQKKEKEKKEAAVIYGNIPIAGGVSEDTSEKAASKPALNTKPAKAPKVAAKSVKKPASEGEAKSSVGDGKKSTRKSKALSAAAESGMEPSSDGDAKPLAKGEAKLVEGGDTPEGSVRAGKAKKSTKKPEQIYENVMHDTQL